MLLIFSYRQVNKTLNDNLFKKLLEDIKKMHNISTHEKKDIINMYNELYLNTMTKFIQELNDTDKEINFRRLNFFNPVYTSTHSDSDFTSLIPLLQQDYNTIYSSSPMIQSTNLFNSAELIGNKRIRQLTPPSTTKLSASPFNTKSSSSFTPTKNNSAFKDLNQKFTKK